MKRFVVIVAAGAAVLTLGVGTARGAICAVPTLAYPTIQDAVSDGGCSTINVAAGTYAESVTIGRPLTLNGPNAGISAFGARGAEAMVISAATTFNVTDGTNVTIDGFTIIGDFGVYVSTSSTGTAIQNNIASGATRALTLDAPGSGARVLNNDLSSNIRSLHVSGGPYTNLKINGNRFSGAAASTGIFFSGSSSNTVTGFEFKNNQVQHAANLASTITNGTVSGNTFNVISPGNLNLQIDLHNSTVSSNSFSGADTTACLQIFGSQFGLVPSDHVTISGNTFSHCNVYGIQLSPDIQYITIKQNTISNNVDGVNTRDFTPWTVPGTIHINFNNITGNTAFGVRNGQSGVLDATCNWWNSASGPTALSNPGGTGDAVSPNVSYEPWLTAPAPSGPCSGLVPSTPGKVTGGGQVEGDPLFSPLGDLISLPALVPSAAGPQSQATFGFSVKCCAPTGNLEYNDHGADVRIKSQTITRLVIGNGTCGPNTHAMFTGTASVIRSTGTTTQDFQVDVDDCGEPGTTDTFGIKTFGFPPYSAGPSTLVGGNIQIH